MSNPWTCALERGPDRSILSGSEAALCDAIRRGADLRVYTEWLYEEHIAPDLPFPADPRNAGVLEEIVDFRQTMLIDDRYAAGVTTLRQPIQPAAQGFNVNAGPRTSFFLYDMHANQACANILLDDTAAAVPPGAHTRIPPRPAMPKMSAEDQYDLGTLGPSRNFVYDMEVYRFFVRDDWEPVLSHDERGQVTAGSWEAFHAAHRAGREFKVALRNPCADLGNASGRPEHEVFTLLGSGWVHTRRRFYEVLSHPIVRIAPANPLRYASFNWDLAWVFVRTDGFAALRVLDPYTRRFTDRRSRLACRWFVR